ncbi:MAG: hypothetical protein INR71_09100 [Terriglobus roseus]|nr:hypothetical protein [Terriglobus roseus]
MSDSPASAMASQKASPNLAAFEAHSKPCPSDEDAFSYNPYYLQDWSMPDDVWNELAPQLRDRITKLQHAGAAVLTSLCRLEEIAELDAESQPGHAETKTTPGAGEADLHALAKHASSLSVIDDDEEDGPEEKAVPHPFPALPGLFFDKLVSKRRHSGAILEGQTPELSPPITPRSGSDSGISRPSSALPGRRGSRRRSSNLSVGSPPPPSPIDPYTLKAVQQPDAPGSLSASQLPSPLLSPSPSAAPLFALPAAPGSPTSPTSLIFPFSADASQPPTPGTVQVPDPGFLLRKPSSFYLAELAHLRSDCLVRLRHAVLHVEREVRELRRAEARDSDSYSGSDDSEAGRVDTDNDKSDDSAEPDGFEMWWSVTKETAARLDERGHGMAEEARRAMDACVEDGAGLRAARDGVFATVEA